MSARTHTRPRPLPRATTGGAVTRLPWWAFALPMAAFAVLLLLMAGSGEAHAAGADPVLGRFLDHLQLTLSR
ncbi:hypothetical protein [Streptomyces purpureus]|uniref:hypothetical protein n=1 Tax=Streptomyces purpureus TaxID=1951 RepID=UPI00037B5D15|nr:hypothetical protein [Streptomyces purpureus]